MFLALSTLVINPNLILLTPKPVYIESPSFPARNDPTLHSRSTVQQAIDNAKEGDIVHVKKGIYLENIVINKTLTLQGAGRDNTIIDGGWLGDTVTISADFVNISGFTILNGSKGIHVISNDTRISDCICFANIIGIYVNTARRCVLENLTCDLNYGGGICYVGSDYNSLINSTCDSNGEVGISLFSSAKNSFTGGSCSGNNGYGMYMYWFSGNTEISDYRFDANNRTGLYIFDSSRCTVSNSTFDRNNGDGLYLMSTESTVMNCNSFLNEGKGLHLYHSDKNIISNCTIERNFNEGICMKYSPGNTFRDNIVSGNHEGIKLLLGSENNMFYGNIFINLNNARHLARDDGTNLWNASGIGNYWSDSTHGDSDGDGMTDVPYLINGTGGSKDHFPLARPPIYSLPIANAGSEIIIEVGGTAEFNGSGSYDDVGIVNYSWEIDIEGRRYLLYGENPGVTFNVTGLFTVNLTVTDSEGNKGFGQVNVHVAEIEMEEGNEGNEEEDLTDERIFVWLGIGGMIFLFIFAMFLIFRKGEGI